MHSNLWTPKKISNIPYKKLHNGEFPSSEGIVIKNMTQFLQIVILYRWFTLDLRRQWPRADAHFETGDTVPAVGDRIFDGTVSCHKGGERDHSLRERLAVFWSGVEREAPRVLLQHGLQKLGASDRFVLGGRRELQVVGVDDKSRYFHLW